MPGEPPDAEVAALVARCTFPPRGTEVVAGVSGGADSLALLVLAVEAGCRVTAVHVDHGLREGSAAEAEVVADVAARLGAGFRSERVVVAPGGDLEARARRARWEVLGPDACTGHTMDDRAETMVLNLLRGAAATGLGALRPGPRHPIVGLRRSDTRGLCRRLGLTPVADPSNDDPRFGRNRVRHEVMPLLVDVAGRDLVPILARQADVLADEADLLESLAADIDPTDARALAAAPLPIARAAVRTWLRPVGDGQPPSAATVERVLAVARGETVATEVAGGHRVSRTARRLRIEPAPTRARGPSRYGSRP